MKCKYCGHEMGDGDIYCENCGKPVQMVPDYNVLEDEVLPGIVTGERQTDRKAASPEGDPVTASGRSGQAVVRTSARTEQETGHEKKAGRKKTGRAKIILLVLAAVLVLVLLGVSRYISSPSYQEKAGDKAYAEKDYSEALSHYRKAEGDKAGAALLAKEGWCHYYLKDDNAEAAFKQALDEDPENEEAFRGLTQIYVESSNYDGLSALKEQAVTDGQVEIIEGAYISEVQFSEEGGEFDDDLELTLSSPEGYDIYYTVNGKEPEGPGGTLYTEPIEITDGKTVIKARAVSPSGSEGPVTEQEYDATYEAPDDPTVSPDGGTFGTPTDVTISSDADGGKIYYTWDGSDPTASSDRYTGPISVPEGNNVLSVIVVDAHGLSSDVYRTNFVYLPQ